jgi:UDP-glucose 4-epimerase
VSKIVVTGGAGFIGSHLVELLLEDGHEVHIIDNLSSGRESNLKNAKGAALHVMDIRSSETQELLQSLEPEVVIHAAAQISVTRSMREPVFDISVNLCGLLNILSAFAGGALPFFTFISTGGAIYGEQQVFPATESHPNLPTSVYGLSKRSSEMYLDLWARQFGLKYGVLRLSNVYGPRQDPHGEAGVVAIFSQLLLEGKSVTIFGSGEQTRDFVYVKDVARAVREVSMRRQTGTYNIGTAIETSINDLLKEFCSIMQCDFNPHYVPARTGEQLRSVIDPSLAKKTFGWVPEKTLRDGLVETLEWFKDEN